MFLESGQHRHSDYAMGWTICGFDSQQGQEIFLFFKISRPTVGSIQPPIHVYQGLFHRGYSNKGVTLNTYLHLVPRLITSGAIPIPLIRLHGTQRDFGYLYPVCLPTITSHSRVTFVSKGILIYISVYSKYLKFMPIFFTHLAVLVFHQCKDGDSSWCLLNPTLLFLFQSREFFLTFLIESVNITYVYLYFILNIPK
jgi:hypothetical protein